MHRLSGLLYIAAEHTEVDRERGAGSQPVSIG